jgi:succinyl-diaminopimelate desuccinylase
MIIAEPTGNRIGVASLGCIWIKSKVHGKSAHAAYPSCGENAIDGLFSLRNAILRILGQEEHPLLGKSTCQLTTIQGGTKVNMIPDFAEGVFDIRTIPSLDQEELMKKIKASVQVLEEGNKNLQFDLSIINQRSSVSIENENSLINRLNDAHQSVFGIPGQITGTRFFSDASVFQQFEGIPTVLYGPGDSEQAHQSNESLDIEAYYKGIEVFYSFIKGFSIL